MTEQMTITTALDFRHNTRGRRRLEVRPKPEASAHSPGRVPRVARLLALALRFAEQLRSGACRVSSNWLRQ